MKKRSESVQSIRMEMDRPLLSKPKVNAVSKRLAESSKYRMKITLEANDKRNCQNVSTLYLFLILTDFCNVFFQQSSHRKQQRSKISNRAHRADVSHAQRKLQLKLEQERLRKEKEERAAAKKRRERKVAFDVFIER